MFKDEGRIWLYFIGVLIAFGIYIFMGTKFFVPFLQGDEIVGKEELNFFKSPPEVTIDTNQDYLAKITTNYGVFFVDLYEKNAPVNVNNFMHLASAAYYNNTKIHRLVPGLFFQGGDRNTLNSDPEDDGKGNPGYIIDDEINWDSLALTDEKKQELIKDGYSSDKDVTSVTLGKYAVAMASGGPDTNGSQFFIVFAESDNKAIQELNGKFTVIGSVVDGFNTIDAISKVALKDTTNETGILKEIDEYRPLTDIVIQSVEIFNR